MHQTVSTILADKGCRVEAIEPTATVSDAVQKMNEHRIGSLLVMEEGRPVGIITERDILTRIVAPRLDPLTVNVEAVMTKELVAIRTTTTVAEAMMVVTEKRCRHLPVLDKGELAGLVSIGDLTRSLIRHQQDEIHDLVSYITS